MKKVFLALAAVITASSMFLTTSTQLLANEDNCCKGACEYPCDFMLPSSQSCGPTCAPACSTPCDPCDPCAASCGTLCGCSLITLGVGVAVVGIAAAAIITSSSGSSSSH